MIGSKRFIRGGFVFSVVGHVGGLLLGVFFFAAGAVPPPPPEAMTVEIVPSNEAPQIETEDTPVDGTPLDSTSSGSELSSDAENGSIGAEPRRPNSPVPSLRQGQAGAPPQRSASLAEAPLPAAAPDEPQPETQPEASEPLLPPTASSEMFAMPLALPGGRLGGGFDAPASHPAMAPHDEIGAFFARVSSCSRWPVGLDADVKIVLRVSFKRDGTLASQPELLDASLSPDVLPLMQTAVDALERCQPFSELPPDKYKKWKTLNIVVSRRALSGG